MDKYAKYNPKDCVVTFGNVYLTGFGEDMVECSKDEDNFKTSVGAQGDVAVSETNNNMGTIKITLQQSSAQRSYLDDCANKGLVLPIWVTDKSLNERSGGTMGRIKKPADKKHGTSAESYTYEVQVFDYVTGKM